MLENLNLPEYLQEEARIAYESYCAEKAKIESEAKQEEALLEAAKAKFKKEAIEAIGLVAELFEVGLDDESFYCLWYTDLIVERRFVKNSAEWCLRYWGNDHPVMVLSNGENPANFAQKIWGNIFEYGSQKKRNVPKLPVSCANDQAFGIRGLTKFDYFFGRILQGEIAAYMGIPKTDELQEQTVKLAIALTEQAIAALDARKNR